jgi:hypothetical protein
MALPYSLGRRAPLPVPSAMSCPPADGRWYRVEAGAEAGPPSSPTVGWREAEDGSRLASTIHSPHVGVSSTTTGTTPLSSVAPTARSKGISEAESRAPPAAACCLARDFGATLLCMRGRWGAVAGGGPVAAWMRPSITPYTKEAGATPFSRRGWCSLPRMKAPVRVVLEMLLALIVRWTRTLAIEYKQ